MNSQQLFDEIKKSYNNKKLAVFVGAGISLKTPANIPHSNDIKKIIFETLCDDIGMKKVLLNDIDKLGLENVISIISEYNPGFVQNFMRHISNITIPNWEHKAVKLISKKSNVCATTNFDCLIESSYISGHQGFKVLHKNMDFEKITEINDDTPILLKLHGSCNTDDFKDLGITLDGIGKSASNKGTIKVAKWLSNYDLLFVGYRGRDIDIMIPMSEGTGRVFWCWHDRNKETPEIINRNNDNPIANAFCKKKDSVEFSCNSTSFLKLLINHLKMIPPHRERTHLDAGDFHIFLKRTINSFDDSEKRMIVSKILSELGHLSISNDILTSINIGHSKLSIEQKIKTMFITATNHREMNDDTSFSECDKILGQIDSQIGILPDKNKKKLFRAKILSIRCFSYQYKGNLDQALDCAKEGYKLYQEGITEYIHDSYYRIIGMHCLLEIGNCLYHQSHNAGDKFDKRIIQSSAKYMELYLLALEHNDIYFQTITLENIAQTHNKWVLQCNLDDESVLNALQFGIKARIISLYYQEFIGNEIAKGRSYINMSYEYTRTGDIENSTILAVRRLEQSITANDKYGIALSIERFADALRLNNNKLSMELYSAAKAQYSISTDNRFFIDNIDRKIKEYFKIRKLNLSEYYSNTPNIDEFIIDMKSVLKSINENKYLGL